MSSCSNVENFNHFSLLCTLNHSKSGRFCCFDLFAISILCKVIRFVANPSQMCVRVLIVQTNFVLFDSFFCSIELKLWNKEAYSYTILTSSIKKWWFIWLSTNIDILLFFFKFYSWMTRMFFPHAWLSHRRWDDLICSFKKFIEKKNKNKTKMKQMVNSLLRILYIIMLI